MTRASLIAPPVCSSLEEAFQRSSRFDFDVLKVPVGISVEKLVTALRNVEEKFSFKRKDQEPRYFALGLQYSREENPLYDAVDALATTAVGQNSIQHLVRRPLRVFPYFNDAAKPFQFVFEHLYPLRVYRTRLLRAVPGYEMFTTHIDGRYGLRLHIPLETNSEAWMEVAGTRYHLPADGSAYLLNTSRPHRVANPGATSRTHLVMVLFEPSFYQAPEIFVDRLVDYFDRNEIDMDLLPDLIRNYKANRGSKCSLCGSRPGLAMVPLKPHWTDLQLLHQPEKSFGLCCQECLANLSLSSSQEQIDHFFAQQAGG